MKFSNSKKVVLLINTMANGGAQRQLSLLAIELKKSGRDVNLVHFGADGFSVPQLISLGIRVTCLRKEGRTSRLRELLLLGVFLRKEGPDLLISFIDSTNLAAGILKLIGFKFKWIASERNLVTSNNSFESAWRNLLFPLAQAVVANSEAQLSWLRKNVRHKKAVFVRNGVDSAFFKNPAHRYHSAHNLIIALGRLSQQKNPELLLEALSLLPSAYKNRINVHWYGDDDPDSPNFRNELMERAQAEKLPIRFFQATENVAAVMDSASCLVLTSRYEGTPNVLLEAMARGLPTLASAVSDIPALMGHGERGWLFPSEDAEALSSSIVNFLNSTAEEISNRSMQAHKYIEENYSARAMAEMFIYAASESHA